jgi:hypothetical protein
MPTCLTSESNDPPIQYRHHRIEVSRVGKGWRASIFAPNAMRPLADSPSNLEKSDKKEIVAQAKRIIGGRYVRTGPFWRRNYWHCPV